MPATTTHEVWSDSEARWLPVPPPGVHPGIDRLIAVGNPVREVAPAPATDWCAYETDRFSGWAYIHYADLTEAEAHEVARSHGLSAGLTAEIERDVR